MTMSRRRATATLPPPSSRCSNQVEHDGRRDTSAKKEIWQGIDPWPPKNTVLFPEAVPHREHAPVGIIELNIRQSAATANLDGAGHRIAVRRTMRSCASGDCFMARL
jgi:hypothetical protein